MWYVCLSLALLRSAALGAQHRPSKAHDGKSAARRGASASSAKIARRQDGGNLLQLGYGLPPQPVYGPPPAFAQPEAVHHQPGPPAPAVFEHSEPLPQPQHFAVVPAPALPLPVRPGVVPPHVVPVGPPPVDFGPIGLPVGPAALPVPVGVPAPALPVHVITKHVAVPVAVPKPYPVHVEKLVHIVRVDRPFPVHVAVPVHVPRPYPVPVAVRAHYDW
ncbi:basic proline-rich protein-like [Phymastichus coffea]|uniref:basic proline-rich protein-like n=1 Tax=Phymastichus coffea TaxID=108790 RepID=UPI00273B58FA|nr:basic proline-rich protein-like [Phymastichus coffea]